MTPLERPFGPKIPRGELATHPMRYQLPKTLFLTGSGLLAISLFFPYWVLRLKAPQFPKGLVIKSYVNRLVGDTVEIEGLNHYVGLGSFDDAAVLERSISVIAIIVLATLLLAAPLIHSRWVVLLTLPALSFPFIFVADLQYWLWKYGHSLDSAAPLASAVGEFTPPVFGRAKIAQFDTLALPGPGFLLAVLAATLIAVGLYYHRLATKQPHTLDSGS